MRTATLAVLLALAAARCGAGDDVEKCKRNSDCSNPSALCFDGICEAECIDNRDCQGEQICYVGRCRTPARLCTRNVDCAIGEECFGGACRPEGRVCRTDDDCGEREECNRSAGTCRAPSPESDAPERECLRSSDCASGLVCLAGSCEAECVDVRDCGGAERCDAGRCVAATPSSPSPDNGTDPPTTPTTAEWSGTFLLSSTDPIQRCNEQTLLQLEPRMATASQTGQAYTVAFAQSTYFGTIDESGSFEVTWSGPQGVSPVCGTIDSDNSLRATFEGPDFFRGNLRTELYFQLGACNCVITYPVVGARQ